VIRTCSALWAVAVLAACSQGGDGANAVQTDIQTNNSVTASQAGTPQATSSALPRGSTLRAQVSDLSGDVSGLNTRVSDMGLVIDLPADTLFDFDKATLTPAAEAELRKVAEIIRTSPPGDVRVIGHTDAKGDDAYNLNLSKARARTVRDWFGRQVGVRQRAFIVSGEGETKPVAPNASPDGKDDPAGRAKNRRVEVVVPKPRSG
jgi:outer membrane protein OmpA-like peptidoglycan-associated protein